jgi:hypothetical protein
MLTCPCHRNMTSAAGAFSPHPNSGNDRPSLLVELPLDEVRLDNLLAQVDVIPVTHTL